MPRPKKITRTTHDIVADVTNALVARKDCSYSTGYLESVLVRALNMLPIVKRQTFLSDLENKLHIVDNTNPDHTYAEKFWSI